MSKLDTVIKELNKKLKNDIITMDKDAITFNGKDSVPFLSPSLEYMFHGEGFKTCTLWTIRGDFSSCKTSISLAIAGQFQKNYKKKWEDRVAYLQSLEKPSKNEKMELSKLLDDGYKRVLFVDVEQSLDSDWASKSGFDASDCVYIKPASESAEEILEMVLQLIQSDCICLVIIDSVAAMTSMSALEKDLTQKTYCGVAGTMTTFTAKLMPLLNKYNCSCICINQLRDNLASSFGGNKMPGGRALAFNSHVILTMKKGKPLDESYKEIPNNSESYYGQYAEVHLDKCKIVKPDRRLTKIAVVFDKGCYALLDTFNLAVAFNIINKSGAWFDYEDENGNVLSDSEGVPYKWQGQTNVLNYMETHVDFYKEIYDKVLEKCK